jgi:hypothetical protein
MTTAASIAIAAILAGQPVVGQQTSVAEPSFVLSCGAITPQTTEADLVQRFGAENVSAAPVFGFDDGPQQGTVLFAERPDAKVEIIWQDPTAKRRPALVMLRSPTSRWRTLNGIALGAKVADLERANGRPFRLAGLQMEGGGGGAVLSWGGGRLQTPFTDECRNGVHLQPAYDGSEAPGLMRQVASGREYSSSHPAIRALNLRVVLLTLRFSQQPVASTTCPEYDHVAYSEVRRDWPGTIQVENLPRESRARREAAGSDLKRSPHGTASYTLQTADTTKPGPWTSVIDVFGNAARPIHLRIRVSDPHQGDVRAHWLNEQLLWLQIWRGRIVSTDAILNVETGRFIYEQDANYNALIVPCSMRRGVPK